MNEPCPVLLVAHPGLGEGLLTAAAKILDDRPRIDHISNEGLSPEEVEERIREWVGGHPGPALILADIGFGSCCQAARRVTRGRTDVGIVAGVNLPMLLAAIRSRDLADLQAIVQHLAERGRGSVEAYLGGDRV
jgi:mannose/fructose-specific phosphotransferase system component IIA